MGKKPVNFRDIGNLPGYVGRRVKNGCLLRSGELWRLSEEEKRELEETWHLGLILDLRLKGETEEKPDDAIRGARYVHLDLLAGLGSRHAASQKELFAAAATADVDTIMQETYRSLALDPHARSQYGRMLRLLLDLEPEKSALWHCFAGKDRTGFCAALVLGILGVSYEKILEDYLFTNVLRKEANEELLKEARSGGLAPERETAFRRILEVDCSYLDASFEALENVYGSFEAYVKNGIGLTEKELERFREKYLA